MKEFTAICRSQRVLLRWDEIRNCGKLYTGNGDLGEPCHMYQCDVIGGDYQEPHLRYEDAGAVVDLASGPELMGVASVLLQLSDWLDGKGGGAVGEGGLLSDDGAGVRHEHAQHTRQDVVDLIVRALSAGALAPDLLASLIARYSETAGLGGVSEADYGRLFLDVQKAVGGAL